MKQKVVGPRAKTARVMGAMAPNPPAPLKNGSSNSSGKRSDSTPPAHRVVTASPGEKPKVHFHRDMVGGIA